MNTMPSTAVVAPAAGYESTRFNALRHGVLSRYAVLPWEDESEYRTLLDALLCEYAPQGPTEEHLVEEVAGVIWRKRRLRLAEAAAYREKLRRDATGWETPGHLVGAALLPITGATGHEASILDAVAATPAETARDLREAKRDQASTRKAWDILASGGSDAYARALAVLRVDTRSYWLECLKEAPSDGLKYEPTATALGAWFDRHWREWYEEPIAELEHRDAIREHAVGSAYATNHLDMLARYEVHLDRKLERTLSMLVRLRELRPGVAPG